MTIIPFDPKWDHQIAELLDASMGPGRFSRTAERLREDNHQIDDYSFLMLAEDGALRGSISFWPITIGASKAYLLGPLAVRPKDQGLGYGQKLMAHALALIDSEQPAPVLLVGDLPYYGKAGFARASDGVVMPGPVDPSRVLVRMPAGSALDLSGRVRPSPYHFV